MEQTPVFQTIIRQELSRRCEKNPRYSLRAFAKSVGIDVGNLSRLLAGKASISSKSVDRLMERLGLTTEERELFVKSLIDEQGKKRRRTYKTRDITENIIHQIDIDLFKIVGDWYHCAILELTFTDGFKAEPKWIAKELGISPMEAKLAVDRLISVGLLKKEGDKLIKAEEQIRTGDRGKTTGALRRLQKQLLEKAIFALENTPIEKRVQSAMTMAIDPSKLPLVNQMIQEFMDRLCVVLENGNKKKVYQLTASLYPLQNLEEK